MKNTTLVTTAIQETWPKSGKILFLGEWCKRHNNAVKIDFLEHETIEYHWNDSKKFYKDLKEIEDIYEECLVRLSEQLNILHSTKNTLKYWRIIIGPWLKDFIFILYDKWSSLEKALKNHNNLSCIILNNNNYINGVLDKKEFINSVIEDKWNELIFGEIIQILYKDRIKISLLDRDINHKNSQKITFGDYFSLLKSFFKKLISYSNFFFQSSQKYIFTNLSILNSIKIHNTIDMKPRIWDSPKLKRTNPEVNKRRWEIFKPNEIQLKNDFIKIINIMLPKHIPIAYIEKYSNLKNQIQNLNYPLAPYFIFTDDPHDDDFLKIYAAEKSKKGTKIIVNQHGGHYGIGDFNLEEKHELKISDYYLSWGWNSNDYENIINFGSVSLKKKKIHNKKLGNALLCLNSCPRYAHTPRALCVSSQYLNYLDDQISLISNLSIEIQDMITVRDYRHDYNWDTRKRLIDRFNDLQFDDLKQPIEKSMRNCRLFIATYNATTFLETLARNFPTIIFWDLSYSGIRDDALSIFRDLEDVGIFHKSPIGASKKINKIWNDVDNWWFSEKVQIARLNFCKKFAKTLDKPNHEISLLFKKIENK